MTCNTWMKRFDSNQAGQPKPQTLTWRLNWWTLGWTGTSTNLTCEIKKGLFSVQFSETYFKGLLPLFSCTVPGGVHFGVLPPAGLGVNVGFDVETVEEEAGLFGASLALGGLLTGVVTAVRQRRPHNNYQMKLQAQPKAESSSWTSNVPAVCDLGFDGFDAGLSFLGAGGCLGFTLLVTFSVFFALLTFLTVNSSSSLSAGSLKSSSLSESGKELLLFYWPKKKKTIESA